MESSADELHAALEAETNPRLVQAGYDVRMHAEREHLEVLCLTGVTPMNGPDSDALKSTLELLDKEWHLALAVQRSFSKSGFHG